jgi:hypothetical protein
MDNSCKIYIIWKVEFIRATHDGYCSGGDNDEEVSYGETCVKYSISKENHDCLFSLRTIKNIFNHIKLTDNHKYIKELSCPGSGYCDPSEHGLYHQLMIILVEPLYYLFDRPLGYDLSIMFDDFLDNSKLNGNSLELEKQLIDIRHDIKVVVTVMLCLRFIGVPKDICKLIGKLVSTTKLFPK